MKLKWIDPPFLAEFVCGTQIILHHEGITALTRTRNAGYFDYFARAAAGLKLAGWLAAFSQVLFLRFLISSRLGEMHVLHYYAPTSKVTQYIYARYEMK